MAFDRIARNRSRHANRTRSLVGVAAVFVAALSLMAVAQTETYPSHPVKLLVPYAPGGATDIIARQLAAGLAAVPARGSFRCASIHLSMLGCS